jgi:uncharacterized repeat protein (TIGR03803 family)
MDGNGFLILHSFVGGANDGLGPLGSPALSGSTIFGMTPQGGTANLGTVFGVSTNGTGFDVIHSFAGGANDGSIPSYSTVTVSGSTLYGMTNGGGPTDFGTVFRMSTDGAGFTLLHSFNATTGDGWQPAGSLILSGSTLYGMTRQGGGGAGEIFKISTDGTGYDILHTFTGQPNGDGANPVGTLTLVGSTLYGTTPQGGVDALGVLFDINTDGSGYNVLYNFTGGPNDGANSGDVLYSGGSLFGITGGGGAYNYGTIFEYSVGVPEPSPLAMLLAVAGLWFLANQYRMRLSRRACA